MDDPAPDEVELRTPVVPIEELQDRQPVERHGRVRSQLHCAGTRPALEDPHVREVAGDELAKRDRPVQVGDDLEIDVRDHVHARSQAVQRRLALLVRERPGQHVDPISRHGPDHEVAPDLEADRCGTLRLALDLAAHGDRTVIVDEEPRRIRPLQGALRRVEPDADHQVALVDVRAEARHVAHAGDMEQHGVARRHEGFRNQIPNGVRVGPILEREELDVAERDRVPRVKRRVEGRRPRLRDGPAVGRCALGHRMPRNAARRGLPW